MEKQLTDIDEEVSILIYNLVRYKQTIIDIYEFF